MRKYYYSMLRFMLVEARNDNYYFLGLYDNDSKRVYIPTLNKSFSYTEISFGPSLTSDYLEGVPSISGKIKYDNDEWGNVEVTSVGQLSKSDLDKIEKHYNKPKKERQPKKIFLR